MELFAEGKRGSFTGRVGIFFFSMDFSAEEIRQYQRHLSLPGFGAEAQGKLKEASVLVVGAGGLGCPALQYLVAAGVGRVGIMDDDSVDASNLQRQVLYTHDDIGHPKAEVASHRCPSSILMSRSSPSWPV